MHLPSTGAIAGEFVPFGEKPGAPPAHELSDGQEVEIIGWRPTGPDGICYHVQRKSDGREWWARATLGPMILVRKRPVKSKQFTRQVK